MTRLNKVAVVTAFFVASLAGAASRAQSLAAGAPASSSVKLPADPRQWINSPPLSMDSLEGKGVVFYFFDEECPNCAANWPPLQTLASQYEGKPLLFIAVNSGSDDHTLRRYVSKNRVGWPVINDYDRSLENTMGVPKLSLQGPVFAVRYVAGDGSKGEGAGADFAGTAESALKGAAWRVDPAEVPPKLRGAWLAIELGDFASAARPVQQAAESKDDSLKAGGDRLLEAVKTEVTAVATEAQESLAARDDWDAFKKLESLAQRFNGYEFDLVERAQDKLKELSKTDAVKKQIAAAKLFDKAVATGSKGTSGAMNRAKGLLKRIVQDYADTEAAEKAQTMLATLER